MTISPIPDKGWSLVLVCFQFEWQTGDRPPTHWGHRYGMCGSERRMKERHRHRVSESATQVTPVCACATLFFFSFSVCCFWFSLWHSSVRSPFSRILFSTFVRFIFKLPLNCNFLTVLLCLFLFRVHRLGCEVFVRNYCGLSLDNALIKVK